MPWEPRVAQACTATANTTIAPGVSSTTNSVTVNCPVETTSSLFSTTHPGATTTSGTFTFFDYDGSGDDTVIVDGGTVANSPGNQPPSIGGLYPGAQLDGNPNGISTLGGDDTFEMFSGLVAGDVLLGDGIDTFDIHGGTIGGDVSGGAGNDTVTISGGTITGNVQAESVNLYGGTINGDISGISGNTLVINDPLSPAPINLRDGVVFSGTNAVATIINTDLAAGGTKTQVFTGFDSVTVDPSTIGFGSGTIGIALLNLQSGSTLFVNGNANMSGAANVVGSTINMIDGATDDVFTLGGLTLNNARILLDINQQTAQADRIVTGAFSAAGANVIVVNLLGSPSLAGPTNIPIIFSTNGINPALFSVVPLSGTPSSLFTYQVIAGANGGLFIRAIPTNVGVVLAPQNAINVATVDTVLDAIHGVTDDAIGSDLGLAVGSQGVQISPTVGAFASGQFAHTEHDGFATISDGIVGTGPSFDADEFSAAISVDLNAAKQFSLDTQYGLNLGLFAGYASTDVVLGAFQGFPRTGDANNQSGMFGGYGLFRRDRDYVLVSATAFLGNTDVSSGVLSTTGNYDTEGYAVTGSFGHIFALSDRMRFDLRGGVLGVTFSGDDFVDSGGNQFGDSEISFGAFKFEPGIYADYQLESGMVLSPYARVDLQQRFNYQNTSSIAGRVIDFDDADFSAAVFTGFNLKMSEMATMSGEVRGKFSADSSTIAGKLGLKIAF